MVPCAWFPEIVGLAKEQPELDLGVHLTLTSKSHSCRWRPISTTARVSGLIDGDGYLWPDVPALRRHAHKGSVEAECRAQIETALAAGLDITHLDTHMGAAAAPEFVELYLKLGREFRLPVLLPRRELDLQLGARHGPARSGSRSPADRRAERAGSAADRPLRHGARAAR